jgi:hypothetical protein
LLEVTVGTNPSVALKLTKRCSVQSPKLGFKSLAGTSLAWMACRGGGCLPQLNLVLEVPCCRFAVDLTGLAWLSCDLLSGTVCAAMAYIFRWHGSVLGLLDKLDHDSATALLFSLVQQHQRIALHSSPSQLCTRFVGHVY